MHVLTLFDRVTEERDSDRRRRAGDLSSWTMRFLSGRSLPQKMMSSAGHMSELPLLLKPLKISPALSCNDEGRSIFLSDVSSKLGVLESGLSGRSQSESASSCSSSGDSMYSAASFIMGTMVLKDAVKWGFTYFVRRFGSDVNKVVASLSEKLKMKKRDY